MRAIDVSAISGAAAVLLLLDRRLPPPIAFDNRCLKGQCAQLRYRQRHLASLALKLTVIASCPLVRLGIQQRVQRLFTRRLRGVPCSPNGYQNALALLCKAYEQDYK